MNESELEQSVELHAARVRLLDTMKESHQALLSGIRLSFNGLEVQHQADIDKLEAEIEAAARQLYPGKATIRLGNGFILRWRQVVRVVAVRGEAAAVRALKRAGLKKLVRRKIQIIETVDREEVRKHSRLVARLRSLRVESYESFSIKLDAK